METIRLKSKVGIVLSGGGSRGAYEVGVLKFIRDVISKRIGRHVQFDIISGTSVGAINGTFLAASADNPDWQAAALCRQWQSLHVEELISLGGKNVFRAARLLFGGDLPPVKPGALSYGGLVESSGLERFVIGAVPWKNIRRNLAAGRLDALSVTATHVGSGQTVTFIDSRDPLPTRLHRDPNALYVRAGIGPRHALASAAIPLLFPAVRIDKAFYVDGGLRQNTPLAPAIRLGAEKLLVISLRHDPGPTAAAKSLGTDVARPLLLAGKVINALMLDHTHTDLGRLERINDLLAAGQEVYGEDFVEKLSGALVAKQKAPVSEIEIVHINPSGDIGELASDMVKNDKIRIDGKVAQRLVKRMARGENDQEGDLLSYFLFDGAFATELIEMGYADASTHEAALCELFS